MHKNFPKLLWSHAGFSDYAFCRIAIMAEYTARLSGIMAMICTWSQTASAESSFADCAGVILRKQHGMKKFMSKSGTSLALNGKMFCMQIRIFPHLLKTFCLNRFTLFALSIKPALNNAIRLIISLPSLFLNLRTLAIFSPASAPSINIFETVFFAFDEMCRPFFRGTL